MDDDDCLDDEYDRTPPDLTKSEDEQLLELHAALDHLLRHERKARQAMREPEDTETAEVLAPDLKGKPLDEQPFVPPLPAPIRREQDTEELLNGLIAECHFLMRAVALPSTLALGAQVRRDFLSSAMDLARTGATVGKSIAKLRAASNVRELRQRHVVEHVERQLPPPAPFSENS